ncbi:hypothetical protein ABH973_006242 [Bradyrhizobium ottawaense]|uniref:hypothetical protein n=1 Tax=Bradyrhizobium ottawaense TaxID=931866 RepID=UPI0035197831
MAPQKQQLDERIKAVRIEADAFIDKRAAEIAKTCPGVPVETIRRSITRGISCACAAALLIAEQENAA